MPKRLDLKVQNEIESPPRVEAFLDDLQQVCRNHNMMLTTTEGGMLVIEKYDEGEIRRQRRDAVLNIIAE